MISEYLEIQKRPTCNPYQSWIIINCFFPKNIIKTMFFMKLKYGYYNSIYFANYHLPYDLYGLISWLLMMVDDFDPSTLRPNKFVVKSP